ncbi:DUF3558 family protein [Kribbella qitaiheensis]|uniref:DUF3558 family protein n=1 Tax=Kribbella qitaiheensis TaxID=1544730 RepID=UPI001625EC09|nr:DUF3558 family protein [Kribbella qitaiheensis]
MRILIAALALALVTGCSSEDTSTPRSESTPTVTPRSSPAVLSSSTAAPDACDLLTASEIAPLMDDAGQAKPGLKGGLPNCQWESPDGRFVQVVGIDASEWARSIPEIVRALQASGQFSDAENMRKLRAAAKLVEAGQDLDAHEACSLFSQMVELQGQPPKTSLAVSVLPTRANPKAVSGQMCSVGTYTSVMVADAKGLNGPLPINGVTAMTKLAHRRAMR